MATLVLVRHGKAGVIDADYDQLSPLGARQMEALGRYWTDRGRPVDRVFVGPLVRQARSWVSFSAGFTAGGGAAPEPITEPGLAEYQALEMMRLAVPQLLGEDPVVAASIGSIAQRDGSLARHKEHLFQYVSRRWARGEIDVPGITPFATFRETVGGALDRVLGSGTNGETVLVFTSGGVVAAAVARALSLDDEKTLELSWIVRNAAFTELLFAPGRLSLLAFNAVPHLDADPELMTLR